MTIALAAWKAKLETVSELKQVGGAANLAATRADTRSVPAAFAILTGESSAANTTGTSIVSQVTTQTVGIIMAVTNERDRGGDAAMESLESLRASIFAALHGQMLTGAHSPVVHFQGAVQEWNAATLWFMDEFRANYLRRT